MGNPDTPSNRRDDGRDDAVTNPENARREDDQPQVPTQYSPEMGNVVITRHRPDEEER
jgi:hypothetical protein